MPRQTNISTRFLLAGVALASTAAVALVLMGGSSNNEVVEYACQGPRVVVLDLSSQNRSDASIGMATDVVAGHILGAAICKESVTVVGVAGGGQVLIDPDVPFLKNLRGPNERARANVVSDRLREIREAVATELDTLYESYDAVDVTSVPALFQAATVQAQTDGMTRVVILTTGVHDEPGVTLNRPLEPGEGEALASKLPWPTFRDGARVTIIGLAQMDGELPAPGNLWPSEVVAFNLTACQTTGATCEAFQVAPLDKALL